MVGPIRSGNRRQPAAKNQGGTGQGEARRRHSEQGIPGQRLGPHRAGGHVRGRPPNIPGPPRGRPRGGKEGASPHLGSADAEVGRSARSNHRRDSRRGQGGPRRGRERQRRWRGPPGLGGAAGPNKPRLDRRHSKDDTRNHHTAQGRVGRRKGATRGERQGRRHRRQGIRKERPAVPGVRKPGEIAQRRVRQGRRLSGNRVFRRAGQGHSAGPLVHRPGQERGRRPRGRRRHGRLARQRRTGQKDHGRVQAACKSGVGRRRRHNSHREGLRLPLLRVDQRDGLGRRIQPGAAVRQPGRPRNVLPGQPARLRRAGAASGQPAQPAHILPRGRSLRRGDGLYVDQARDRPLRRALAQVRRGRPVPRQGSAPALRRGPSHGQGRDGGRPGRPARRRACARPGPERQRAAPCPAHGTRRVLPPRLPGLCPVPGRTRGAIRHRRLSQVGRAQPVRPARPSAHARDGARQGRPKVCGDGLRNAPLGPKALLENGRGRGPGARGRRRRGQLRRDRPAAY